MLKCGIVGLPNVGKSTLFNALTNSSNAQTANYPFCTIEPNVGIVAVPDERLEYLAQIASSNKIIPAYISFVDIAGLVKGASKGEGLGNKFLSHIREVDAILHVVRCFEDKDIIHVHNEVNPLHDKEIIEYELIISDLESVEKRLASFSKLKKSGAANDRVSEEYYELLNEAYNLLKEGKAVRHMIGKYDYNTIKQLQLITSKPMLYVANLMENEVITGNEHSKNLTEKAKDEKQSVVQISSKIEAEIASLENEEEKKEFLSGLGLDQSGLNKMIRASYELLNLQSFYTIGPKEAHAWQFQKGILAPQAAGIIHSDFEKGFIRAEVISYDDYIYYKSEAKIKENGKMRLEGKEYRIQDGDIVHFRFNV